MLFSDLDKDFLYLFSLLWIFVGLCKQWCILRCRKLFFNKKVASWMKSLYLHFNGLGNNLHKLILFEGSREYAYWVFNMLVFVIGVWILNERKLMKYILSTLNTDRKTLFSKLPIRIKVPGSQYFIMSRFILHLLCKWQLSRGVPTCLHRGNY